MKYLKISILRNIKSKNEHLAFLKICPEKCSNYIFFGNEVRRNLLQNLLG